MSDLLVKIQSSKVSTSPYPHILIQDFLPSCLLSQLHDFIFNVAPNLPYSHTLISRDSSPEVLSKYLPQLSDILNSEHFVRLLTHKYQPFISTSLPNYNEALQLEEPHHAILHRTFTPTSNNISHRKIRSAHIDDRRSVFNFLIYIRHPDDPSSGGGLKLYSYKKGFLWFSPFFR